MSAAEPRRALSLELVLALLLPAIIVAACAWLTWTASTSGFTALPAAEAGTPAGVPDGTG